ncbi:S-layer domain protein [Paenibacillus curdlanolyticus YK9]|uniref:S-layer domain protein n=1 Tax=Paenibacillus curdlanolyticus YK9 TaxID=717606 RepID=E0I902_9BACL|nr:S-layer homology domain-containing protein [Paenibacillus curdlanolyticus]EFM10886.1 S-layer domain protein [Paenibacillus curdlanolyticus YK9]
MKRSLAKWLLAAMFVAVVQPLLVPQKAEAALPPVFGGTINATEDKSYDPGGDYNAGFSGGVHIVGYQRDPGVSYGDSILVIKFPIDSGNINPTKTVETAKLYLGLQSVDNDPDVPDTQETYKIFLSPDVGWAEGNAVHVNEATLTPAGVYGIDVFKTGVTVELDITSYLNTFRAANPAATAVTVVVKGPLESELGAETAAGKATYVNALVYDRTYSVAAKRPHIDIYYSANSAPTDIALSNANVNENQASGTAVGDLSATDVDAGETFTYSLVAGAGSTDNASFTITGNQLKTAAVFDKEAKSSYSVRVRVTDSASNTYEKPFTVTVNDVNEAPSGTISINGGAAATNSQNVTLTLTKADPEGDALTMSFSNDNVTWSTPVAFAATKSYTLPAGDGTKTVYLKLTDGGGLSGQSSDTIILDTTAPTGSVTINNGDALTNNANVNLTLSASDVLSNPLESQFSSDGTTWSGWEAYGASKSLTLPAGDGSKTVSVQFRDAVGNVSAVVTDSITLDTTAPVGTVVIESGKAAVNATAVQLQVGNADATAVEMQFRNESGAWNGWEPYAATKGWALSTGDGTKTVSVQFKDAAGNVSAAFSDTITLDTAAPVVTGVTNSGLYNTDKTITFPDGTGVLDSSAFNSGDTVTAEGAHTLTVTDDAGNATVITFTIDKTPPSGALTISNGDTATKTSTVSLGIANPDGTAVQMQFSNDGTTWSGWEAYAATKSGWALSGGGDGTKTVHVQLKDAAGNVSSATDTIVLDTTPPNGSVVIKGGAAYTNDTAVQLTIANPDGTADTMRIQNAGGSWSGWQAFDPSVAWTLSTGDGLKTVNIELADALGNVYATSDTITLDQTAPTVGGVTDNGLYNTDRTITFSDGSAELNGSTVTSGTVVSSEGTYTLVVTDLAGNHTDISFEIDKTAPSAALTVNSGDAATKQTSVSLAIANADSTAVQMQFSNDGTTWSGWEAYAASKAGWALSVGDGSKTVHVELKDAAGNVSSATDGITLDTTPPDGSVVIKGGAAYTNVTAVQLTIANPDGTADTMRIQNAGGTWTAWQAVDASVAWTLSAGEGLKTVNIELADTLGNVYAASDTITLDQTAPTVGGVADNGLYNTDRTVTFSDGSAELNGSTLTNGATVSAEGTYTLVVTDLAGNHTDLSFEIDKTGPDGAVTVNSGDTYTTDTAVDLAITNPDGTAVSMQFSNDGATWSGWEAIAATKSGWTLTNGDGSKTVHVQLKDAAGNVYEASDSITLDTTAPDGTLVINSGESTTNATSASLTISNPDSSAVSMQFQNDGGAWSAWEPIGTPKAWTLPAGEGLKTINLRLKDAAGNVYETNASITLDTTAPTSTVTINSNDSFASSLSAQLAMTSDGTADQMRFSNDAAAWSAWESYQTSKAWTLQTGDGNRTVYMEVKDAVGNISRVSDSIVVDMTSPTGTASVNGGAALTTDADVTIDLTTDDGAAPASGVTEVSVSVDGGSTWSSWTAITPQLSATLASGYGTKTVQIKVRDAAGNESAVFSDSIEMRSVPVIADHTTNGTEDTAYSYTAADFSFTSADGAPLHQIKLLTLPLHGALTLDGVAVTTGQQIAAADIVKLAFTPDKDWNGHTALKWSGESNGVPAAGNATVDLVIAAVNDAPVAQDGAVTVTGNAEAKGTVKATDVEGDTLTYAIVTQPATGTLTLDAATGAFTFKPALIGKETFTFRAYDGVAYSDPMTITITNNASPIVIPPTTELPISVPGTDAAKLKDLVKTEVGTTDLGKTVTVGLEGDKWKGNLPNKSGDPFVIVINPKQAADAGVIKLNASMAGLLGDDKRDLVLELDGRTIRVSADMLKAFADQMTDPTDVLRIELAPAKEADANKAIAAVKKIGAKVVAIPMHYQVYIDRKGKRVDLAKIKGYVAVSYRPEELTEEPTTAALLQPNGKLKSLPTRFVKHDKQTEIRVHGLTQGTFVLISMNGKFSDTPKHWAEQSINGLANRLIINGIGNGLFAPNRTATRAEFSSILVQAFGLYGNANALTYSDTNADAWYGESLALAGGSGLITGYTDGTFRPNATITREEAMVILARAAELVGLNTKLTAEQKAQALRGFGDAASIHSWSRDAAALCVSLGIVNGIGANLQPDQPITRAQLTVMVENLLKKADYI